MRSNPAQNQLCLPFPEAAAKSGRRPSPLSNEEVARRLDEIADLLEGQGADFFLDQLHEQARLGGDLGALEVVAAQEPEGAFRGRLRPGRRQEGFQGRFFRSHRREDSRPRRPEFIARYAA